MTVGAVLLAQASSAPGWEDVVGPYGGVAVLVIVVYALLKDRTAERTRHENELATAELRHATEMAAAKATYEADITAHRQQLDVERQANRELADRLVDSAERFAPILVQAAQSIEMVAAREHQR